jgi:hypothetical protein
MNLSILFSALAMACYALAAPGADTNEVAKGGNWAWCAPDYTELSLLVPFYIVWVVTCVVPKADPR